MRCQRCSREIAEEQAYNHQSQTLCDDCYLEVRAHPRECDPWATYLATHTRERMGQRGTEGLTEMEKRVYEFIKSRGKATREEVMANFKLGETEMDAQILPLMRLELVKERSEGNELYLVLVG